jgi:hypothetical protein
MKRFHFGGNALLLLMLQVLAGAVQAGDVFPTDFAAADVNIGERLFLETRFSQFFFTNSAGNPNAMPPGDPVVATLKTSTGSVPGPFAGQAMNCRQCHLVDEEGYGPFGNQTLGNRTYADFARRSPIPLRDDGRTQTPRNALPLVDALIPRSTPLFLHNDGQFASAHDLILGTITGRNYGWEPQEYATAVQQIVSIIRNDNGMGYLATEARGGRWRVEDTYVATYANIFAGFTNYEGSYVADPRVLKEFMISPQYRLDMRYKNASDEQILDTVASLIQAYLANLFFSQATNGLDFEGDGTAVFNGSPFDVFLIKNNLPQLPAAGETALQYSQRLLKLVTDLKSPQYVTDPADGTFTTHNQLFQFGEIELTGLKIFLTNPSSARAYKSVNEGNCVACHSLPAFTDFIFHNTGASQEEYEAIHGPATFNALQIPGLNERLTNYNAYLPATPSHPYATGRFETPPTLDQPGQTDLGLWNVYANPDFPAPQAGLAQILPLLLGLTTPQIATAGVSKKHFVFSGTNGTPGTTYYVLAASSLAATNWTAVATNTFDAQGHFSFKAPLVADAPQTFYKLSLRLPTPAEELPATIALFKTPTLRDLGQSDPYLHTGRMNTLEDVIKFYQKFSTLARQSQLRNPDPELQNIHLADSAIAPLAAFLRALNEDYTD